MHLILLSGGSGKRLWPLSNDIRSKQFLKVLKSSDGTYESMVQRVYRQLMEIGGWSSVTVTAGASQRDQLELQLGKKVQVVIEPQRRNTFPAIVLSCAYLADHCGVHEEEAVVVLPVDPYVEGDYFQCIKRMQEIIREEKADLVLMGAAPVFPSDKYGYIIPKSSFGKKKERCKGRYKDRGAQCFTSTEVAYFKEKPSMEEAKELIGQGALWNCGVFGMKICYVMDFVKQNYGISDFSYLNIQHVFDQLHATSFDYEVVEQARNVRMIRYEGAWKDLGTWETLTEEMACAVTGNVITDGGCENTHIINEKSLPIAVMGIKDAVVVASNDGILVANKGRTYKVKDLMADIKIRPMYEEKRWGKYTVIEHTTYENRQEALTKKLFLNEGQQISYQYHNHRKEIWNIIRGRGILYFEGEKKMVQSGDVVSIQEGKKHGIMALTDLEIIEVQLGSPLIEDDIVRLEYDWK